MPQRARTWPCSFAANDSLTVELENNGGFILTATQAGEDSVILLAKEDAQDMAFALLNPLSFFIPNDPVPEPDTMSFRTPFAAVASRYRDLKANLAARFVSLKDAVTEHLSEHLDGWLVFPACFVLVTALAFVFLAGFPLFLGAAWISTLKASAWIGWMAAVVLSLQYLREEKLS